LALNRAGCWFPFPPEYHLTGESAPSKIESFLKERGVEIVKEMTGNFGAWGDTAHAFHVLDPDGNTIELHAYE